MSTPPYGFQAAGPCRPERGRTTRGPAAAARWDVRPSSAWKRGSSPGAAAGGGRLSPSLPWRPARRALSPQNLPPDKIFHVVVAPCYDRKLEALREDLSPALHGCRGADCVLTSGEQCFV